MSKLLYIAIGGAVGSLLRYGISGLTHKYMDGILPWGTLMVNLIGCFIIGFLWHSFEMFIISPYTRLLIFVGVLGAFTTFSTYGVETINLIRESEVKFAILNILASNLLGLLMVYGGFITSRYLIETFR